MLIPMDTMTNLSTNSLRFCDKRLHVAFFLTIITVYQHIMVMFFGIFVHLEICLGNESFVLI